MPAPAQQCLRHARSLHAPRAPSSKKNAKAAKAPAGNKRKRREEESGDIEITFEPGLREAGEQLLKNMNKKQVHTWRRAAAAPPRDRSDGAQSATTPWEQYLQKRSERRKERRCVCRAPHSQ